MKLDINIFGYIVILFTIGVSLKIFLESDAFNLKCIVSTIDGNTYCVRERNKIQLVADLFAKITQKMIKLVDYVSEKYPNRENCQLLKKNFNPKKVSEILPTSKYTAYSENKGEKMAFCATTTKQGNKIIDENTLTFVAIHELSHIGTKTIGHTSEFWKNFKFFLQNAEKINIYKPVNYKETPIKYCSMKITDNPYFDL